MNARLILPFAMLLAACAGTSARQLDERTLVLSGSGGMRGEEEAMRRIVFAAASEAQRRGFPYFTFLPARPGDRGGDVRVRFLTEAEAEAAPDSSEIWTVADVLAAEAEVGRN